MSPIDRLDLVVSSLATSLGCYRDPLVPLGHVRVSEIAGDAAGASSTSAGSAGWAR